MLDQKSPANVLVAQNRKRFALVEFFSARGSRNMAVLKGLSIGIIVKSACSIELHFCKIVITL